MADTTRWIVAYRPAEGEPFEVEVFDTFDAAEGLCDRFAMDWAESHMARIIQPRHPSRLSQARWSSERLAPQLGIVDPDIFDALLAAHAMILDRIPGGSGLRQRDQALDRLEEAMDLLRRCAELDDCTNYWKHVESNSDVG